MGSLSFSQTDDTCPRTRAWGVAGALTWNRTTLVGSRGAGRLLADPWAADVRPPPSATLLDSLALSTCSLWSGQVQSRAQTGLRPLPAPPARCLPPHPSARGPVDEGELLGCQQDPVGAPHQLQLLDAQPGGERKSKTGKVVPILPPTPANGSLDLLLTQNPPAHSVSPPVSPSAPAGLRGHPQALSPTEPLGPAQGWTRGLMCLLVPTLGVFSSPGGLPGR